MFDFVTEQDVKEIQAKLVATGYDLKGSMIDPAQFTRVLNQVFDNIKDELIHYPGDVLFTHLTGNLGSAYEQAERELKLIGHL